MVHSLSAIEKVRSFTARGAKYVFHPQQISSFLEKKGQSVITTSIAPTNACNLHCSYCNQSQRQRGISLSLEKIQEYINALKERGLKSVIIAGGGEPTMYPRFNELVKWLKDKNLSLALITNGTNNKVSDKPIDTWNLFDWIRVSLNFDNGNLKTLKIPKDKTKGKIGFSMVYTNQSQDMLKQVADIAEEYDARFVRIIPDFCKSAKEIQEIRKKLITWVEQLKSSRFFVQNKIPAQAKALECHQSRIKPFLLADGKVAPCDCFMQIRGADGKFFDGNLPKTFNLCSDETRPASYIDYLDRKFIPGFNPQRDCNGCGYIENNLLLQDLIDLRKQNPSQPLEQLWQHLGIENNSNIIDKNFV